MKANKVFPRLILASLFGALLTGCAPTQFVLVTTPSAAPIAPVPDQATIVVIQPNTEFRINICDARAQIVGQVDRVSQTVIRVPAGPVRLYAVGARGGRDRIEGNVLAGRIYFATIGMRYMLGMTFLALNPRSNDNRWAHKDEWVAKVPHLEIDPQKLQMGATATASNPIPTIPWLREADDAVDKMDQAHRQERTILAEDGLPSP